MVDEAISGADVDYYYGQVCSRPFKITNCERNVKLKKSIIVAASLREFIASAVEHLNASPTNVNSNINHHLHSHVRIVLEMDGTEIEDDDYFSTLDEYTKLMVLFDGQQWTPTIINNGHHLEKVPSSSSLLHQNHRHRHHHQHQRNSDGRRSFGKTSSRSKIIHQLDDDELELLSDMDPDSVDDIMFPEKLYIDQVRIHSSSGGDNSSKSSSTPLNTTIIRGLPTTTQPLLFTNSSTSGQKQF